MAVLSSGMSVERAKSIVDKHYELLASQSALYKERDFAGAERVCLRDVELYEQFRSAYIAYEAWFTRRKLSEIVLPRYPAFSTLAKIYEKQEKYDKAIEVCQLALRYGEDDGTKGGYKGRIERLQRKKAKPLKLPAAPEQAAKKMQKEADERQNRLAVAKSTSEQVSLKVQDLDWYISVSFKKSTSDNFDSALFLAKNATDYLETEINGNKIYQAFYSSEPQDFLNYLRLYELVKDWKSSFVMINGQLIDRKIVQGINYCYGDKCRSGKKDFCFGASDFTQNPFGCHRLQISAYNHPWWSFTLRTDSGYRVDKSAIRERAKANGAPYKLCPAFNKEAIQRVINNLPDAVTQRELSSMNPAVANQSIRISTTGSKRASKGCLSTVVSALAILLVALLCAGLIACGGPPSNVTPVIYQLGCNALSAADDYIGGKISSEDINTRLEEINSQIDMEELKSESSFTTTDKLIIASVNLLTAKSCFSTIVMSEFMQTRDDLAKALGK